MTGLAAAAAEDHNQPTQASDLPDAVLEVVFSFCASKDTVAAICLTCQRWLTIYQRSNIPLPLLSLTGPLHDNWMRASAQKLVRVGVW